MRDLGAAAVAAPGPASPRRAAAARPAQLHPPHRGLAEPNFRETFAKLRTTIFCADETFAKLSQWLPRPTARPPGCLRPRPGPDQRTIVPLMCQLLGGGARRT